MQIYIENKDMTERPKIWKSKKNYTTFLKKEYPKKRPMGHTDCLKNIATNKLNKTMILPACC